jgi:hypothetical protein
VGGDTPIVIGPFQTLDSGGTFSHNVLDLPLIRHYQRNIVATKEKLNDTREAIVSAFMTSYLLVLRAKLLWMRLTRAVHSPKGSSIRLICKKTARHRLGHIARKR